MRLVLANPNLRHREGNCHLYVYKPILLTHCRYSKLPPTPIIANDETAESKVEMVTVPALGAEWGKEEMYQMTKTGRKEKKREDRKEFWKAWNRDQRGLCGRYFTRKVLVFFLFGICCLYVLHLSIGSKQTEVHIASVSSSPLYFPGCLEFPLIPEYRLPTPQAPGQKLSPPCSRAHLPISHFLHTHLCNSTPKIATYLFNSPMCMQVCMIWIPTTWLAPETRPVSRSLQSPSQKSSFL